MSYCIYKKAFKLATKFSKTGENLPVIVRHSGPCLDQQAHLVMPLAVIRLGHPLVGLAAQVAHLELLAPEPLPLELVVALHLLVVVGLLLGLPLFRD